MKKRLLAILLSCVAVFGVSTTAFAAEVPEEASVAEIGFTGDNLSDLSIEEQAAYLDAVNNSGISTYNTVYGNAGSSWVYLTRVDSLKSQSSHGINCSYKMAALAWGLAYSDGNSASGIALPFSKNWSGENVEDHSSAKTVSVTFTATATTTDGKVLASLMPTSVAYIY